MEKERKFTPIKYNIIKLVIFAILGVMVIVFRETHVENLRMVVGTLMLLYGIEEIIYEAIFYPRQFDRKTRSYFGLVEIIVGITFLCVNSITYESVCVTWAVWSMIRESYEIKEIIAELHAYVPRFVSLIESIIVFIFSIMLIINPTEHHALTHLYLLVFELILNPLVPLADDLIIHYKKNSKEKKISGNSNNNDVNE